MAGNATKRAPKGTRGKAKAEPKADAPKVGRPRAEADEAMIERLAIAGCPLAVIASLTGVSESTLKRNFDLPLKKGAIGVTHFLRAQLIAEALDPEAPSHTAALIFACKTIAGLRENAPEADEDGKPKGAIIDVSGDDEDDDDAPGYVAN